MEIIEVTYHKRRRQMSEEFATALAVNRGWINYRNSRPDRSLSEEDRLEKMTDFIRSALAEIKNGKNNGR